MQEIVACVMYCNKNYRYVFAFQFLNENGISGINGVLPYVIMASINNRIMIFCIRFSSELNACNLVYGILLDHMSIAILVK